MLDIIENKQERDGIRKMAWHGTRLVQWIADPANNIIQLIESGEGGRQDKFVAEIIQFPKPNRKLGKRKLRRKRVA